MVDGGSADGSIDFLRAQYPWVRVIPLPRNLGFTGNVNAGLRAAAGDALALLNNDAEADPHWIGAMVSAMRGEPRIGSVASKILHRDDRQVIGSAGDCLGMNGLAAQRGNGEVDCGQYDRAEEVFAASGGAVLYSREMLRDVGLLDEGFVSYLEDVDLGLRARLRGWACWYEPAARVYHQGSATGGGPLASFYVARNTIRLIARGFPTGLLRRGLPAIMAGQRRRALDAARAWRGAAARATLRGQIAGLANLPDALRSRRVIQARRTVMDNYLLEWLTAPP